MSTEIVMPQLGETVAEGTVGKWFKQEGDSIAVDELILEVETDKVTTEVPALVAGTLSQILVGAGETVAVGTPLAVIDGGGGARPSPPRPPAPTPTPTPATAPAAAPLSPVVRRLIDEHGLDKAAITATGKGGRITRQDVLRAIEGKTPVVSPPVVADQGNARPGLRDTAGRPLSPVVRRLLAEHHLDPAQVSGSGRDGRIRRDDVLGHLEGAPAPVEAPGLSDDLLPFNRLRRLTAEHMLRSKATSPHVLQAIEADFHNVEKVRRARKDGWKKGRGFSLTYLPFIARATCLALAEFPRLNGSVEGDALRLHATINLAIAIDLDFDGLMAPVITDAGTLTVAGLAKAIHDLAGRARAGKLGADDLAGGTYTISNSGTFGTLITAPIINQPQVAILSTDGVRKKPVVIEGPAGDSIAIHPVGVLAQSFDHRAIDGAYSAAFLRRIGTILENHDWLSEVA